MTLEEQIQELKEKLELKSNIVELQLKIIKYKDESLLNAMQRIKELELKK